MPSLGVRSPWVKVFEKKMGRKFKDDFCNRCRDYEIACSLVIWQVSFFIYILLILFGALFLPLHDLLLLFKFLLLRTMENECTKISFLPTNMHTTADEQDDISFISIYDQRYTYRVLQTIQMKLVLLCVWAEGAVHGRAKTASKFKY